MLQRWPSGRTVSESEGNFGSRSIKCWNLRDIIQLTFIAFIFVILESLNLVRLGPGGKVGFNIWGQLVYGCHAPHILLGLYQNMPSWLFSETRFFGATAEMRWNFIINHDVCPSRVKVLSCLFDANALLVILDAWLLLLGFEIFCASLALLTVLWNPLSYV